MGTDPSIQTKPSRLDVTPLTEVETAGGVMTKPTEEQNSQRKLTETWASEFFFFFSQEGLAMPDPRVTVLATPSLLASMVH